MAKEYLISDFLKRIKRPIELSENSEYKLVTIKMNHNGVTLREIKRGFEIKSNMYLVKEGDFILSGIDARNGAFGIIPKELDNAIVTNDFWYFEIDEDIILKELFLELTATNWFDEICKKGSDGTTQRIRLQKDKFFNQKVGLPEKVEQQDTLSKVKEIKKKLDSLNFEKTKQEKHIQNLKQSILQEALDGKLTENWRKENPNVESASELLNRLNAEQEKLILEKKRKKEKPLKPITNAEIPFTLPIGWTWCRLGAVAQSLIGLTYKPSDIVENGIPVLRSNNIKGNTLFLGDLVKVKSEVPLSKMTKYGDILVCVRNGSKKLIGKVAIIESDGYSFGAFMSILRSNINSNYLYYYLLSNVFRNQIDDEKSTGINQLTQGILNNILFVLPPIEEQQAIVAKVAALIEKCNQFGIEIENLKRKNKDLLKAFFNETFEMKTEVCQD
jgi:type I restriction enzyme S subunit